MTERQVLQPSAAHPITITPTTRKVTVTIGGAIVAQTDRALTLQESTYPAVQYIPRDDLVSETLTRSDSTTYCPFKGEANYYHVGGVEDAAWTYEQAYPAVAEITGHLAFYPDKAQIVLA